jgi:hypothetical protein
MSTHMVRMVFLLMRLSVLLLAQTALRPEELLGGFALLLNALCLERLACGTSECFDDNLLLQTTVVARLVDLMRSTGPPPSSSVPSIATGFFWSLVGLFATHHAKRPYAEGRWFPAYLATVCGVVTCTTYARMEPLWMHGARAVGLATLSAALYSEAPPAGALVGRRGFLLCFLPIMWVHWIVAWLFATGAIFVMAWRELRELRELRV